MADPWVAPDTPASPPPAPAPAPPPAAPAGGTTPSPVRAGALPLLRPLTTTDILDGGLRAWKAAPATLAAITAAVVVPAQVLVGYLTRDAVEDLDLGNTFADAFTTSGADDVDAGLGGDLFFLGMLVDGLTLALVTLAVARLVAGRHTGQHLTFRPLVGVVARRSWVVAVAWLLVHAVEAVFALGLFVPAIVPMTWFAVVSAVVACEDVGPIKAMKRSYRLCRRRFGAVLGVCLLTALVDAALSAALTAMGAVYLEAGLPAGWVVNTAVSAAALLVTVPFVAAVVTLLYLDLRARTEGLDIELAAARVFAPA